MVTGIKYLEIREEDDSLALFFFHFANGRAASWSSVSAGVNTPYGEKRWGDFWVFSTFHHWPLGLMGQSRLGSEFIPPSHVVRPPDTGGHY